MVEHKKPWIDLKKLRQERGWLQRESAKKLGFSRSYIAEIESGKQDISTKMMYAIINVYGVQYEDFYKENKKECVQ